MNTVTARHLDGLLWPLVHRLPASVGNRSPGRPEEVPVLQAALDAPLVAIKLVGLGSLALLAPALAGYAERSGRPTFLVTVAANRALLDLLDWRVSPVYLRSERAVLLGWDVIRQARRLRRLRPAAVVDLEFHSAFTALFGYALRPLRHVVLDDPRRRGPATDAVTHAPDLHFADLARGLLSALAGVALPSAPALPLRQGALPPPAVRQPPRRRVVVNVNSGIMCLERRLPPTVFRDLMQGLAGAADVEFHLIGDRREAAYTAQFAATLPAGLRVANRAGHLDLRGVLGLLRDTDLLISNDTGPVHLAAAVGAPTLAVFGPESPARFGPRGRVSTVIWGRMPCGPCLTAANRKTAPCHGDNRCLQQLIAADLLPAALELLGGRGRGVHSVGPRLAPPPGTLQMKTPVRVGHARG